MKIAFVYNLQRNKTPEEAEFDTPETIQAIRTALASEGDEVVDIEMTRNGKWIQLLADERPDIVFNTAEGYKGIGREGYAPIVFEQMGLPYVGSGPYACFLTLDKFLTKQVVSHRNIPVPEGYFVADERELLTVADEAAYPLFVKPNFEGSSKGITSQSLCRSREELMDYATKCLREFRDGILIERYIEGKDLTIPFIGGLGYYGVLDPIEYVGPKKNDVWIYDYDLKNLHDEAVGVRYPADVSEDAIKRIKRYMRFSVRALGVYDMGRADFRITPSGDLYFIEFNALPSLQPGAGVFEATKHLGLTYNETIQSILSASIKRQKVKRTKVRPARRIRLRDPQIAVVFNLKRKAKDEPGYELEAEFDSESTVNALVDAVRSLGYSAVPIEATRNLGERLIEENIDLVFNIAEGLQKRGREAQVPAVCDLVGIEHTGSDATCLAVTLDKSLTSKLVASEGIRAPRSKLLNANAHKFKHDLAYPVIAKPNLEGTSKGIYESSVARNPEELAAAISRLKKLGIESILCEEYIVGREFTIGVLEFPTLTVLGPMEIEFKKDHSALPVYSFEAKQLENQLDNEYFRLVCPVDLSQIEMRKVHRFAKNCFKILGCRDVARIDFRIDPKGEIFFLEANPLPGLSPGFSDLTIMAEKCGWTYPQLIETILMPAVRRWRKGHRPRRTTTGLAI